MSWLQAATRSGLHPNSATVAGLGYLLIAPAGIRLPRCDDAVWSVEMARIVHCVWLIPCDYGVRFVCNPTCHLGGGFLVRRLSILPDAHLAHRRSGVPITRVTNSKI